MVRAAQSQGESRDHEAVSFDDFYMATAQRTFDLVRRAAAGDRHLAEDATQDAYLIMLAAWGARESRSLDDNARYVIGIAMNRLMSAYRKRNRITDLDDHAEHAITDPRIEQLIDEISTLQAVREVLRAQPTRRRMVGVLYFLDDRGPGEIADLLGISPSTVRTQVERLRRLLQPFVDRIAELGRGGNQP